MTEMKRGLNSLDHWIMRVGMTFEWSDDWGVDHQKEYDCYEDGEPATCETCSAYIDGALVSSLSCIDDATDEYRREIEHELARDVRSEGPGTLVDAYTDEDLGPASWAARVASDRAGEEGLILVDEDGDVVGRGSWAAQQPGVRVAWVDTSGAKHSPRKEVTSDGQ